MKSFPRARFRRLERQGARGLARWRDGLRPTVTSQQGDAMCVDGPDDVFQCAIDQVRRSKTSPVCDEGCSFLACLLVCCWLVMSSVDHHLLFIEQRPSGTVQVLGTMPILYLSADSCQETHISPVPLNIFAWVVLQTNRGCVRLAPMQSIMHEYSFTA